MENCDAVAAVCEDDSVNLMAAQIAKNIFRREKVICRVSDPHLQVLYHKTYELDTDLPHHPDRTGRVPCAGEVRSKTSPSMLRIDGEVLSQNSFT